jgi:hypothetical protein
MGEIMIILSSVSLRSLVEEANSIGVKHESIVTLTKDNEQWILVYYE